MFCGYQFCIYSVFDIIVLDTFFHHFLVGIPFWWRNIYF